MAQLIQHQGKYYKGEPGAWEQISPQQFQKEAMMQRGVQSQSALTRGLVGAGYYFQNLASGARELDYGGLAFSVGQFGGAASSAVLPGGLKAQMGIGAAQSAAENPDNPALGAALGAGLTWAGDWAAESLGRITRTLTRKRAAIDPDYAATLARGEAEGLRFTPGQKADDPATRMMEKQLMKNPRYAPRVPLAPRRPGALLRRCEARR